MLKYHHCRCLESVIYGKVKANPKYSDPDLEHAYLWLENQIGFYPIFLAVGVTDEDIRMTGYQNQWRKIVGTKISGRRKDGSYLQKNILMKKGEFPNDVLFSFEDINGVFIDYYYWHLVLNARYKNYQMTDYEKRLILKPSWLKSDWLRKSRDKPHSVQLATSQLYLPDAKRIWVRNQKTKELLTKIGFENVEPRRVKIQE